MASNIPAENPMDFITSRQKSILEARTLEDR